MLTGRLTQLTVAVMFLVCMAMAGCSEQAERILVPATDIQTGQTIDAFAGLGTDYNINEFIESQFDPDDGSAHETDYGTDLFDKQDDDEGGGTSDPEIINQTDE
jgi:hypothetical protein